MPDGQTMNAILGAYGVSSSGVGHLQWAGLIGGVIFGIIGFSAFAYGKKEKSMRPMVIGIALMAYPYFFYKSWTVYVIGIALTAALWFWRE